MHAHCSPDSVLAQSLEGRRPHYLCSAGEGQVNFQGPSEHGSELSITHDTIASPTGKQHCRWETCNAV